MHSQGGLGITLSFLPPSFHGHRYSDPWTERTNERMSAGKCGPSPASRPTAEPPPSSSNRGCTPLKPTTPSCSRKACPTGLHTGQSLALRDPQNIEICNRTLNGSAQRTTPYRYRVPSLPSSSSFGLSVRHHLHRRHSIHPAVHSANKQ